ncbi:MAG: head GIN domain-containing protein [Bacteroidota bacterium]
MKNILFFLLCGFLPSLNAQEGSITMKLQSFDEVKGFDGISIELIKSNVNKAEISGANTTKVAIVNNKGVLKIRMNIDKIFSGYRTFVKLYYSKDLKIIDINEDAQIYSNDVIVQRVLDLRAQESGELQLNCQVEQLLAKAVTGGDIVLKGFTENQDVIINTGGSFQGSEFKSKFTTVKVNAGGNASIYATKYVKADVKAGGTVKVFGDPEKVDQKTVFGGKIERIE